MSDCSRCGSRPQLPTGTLCMECLREDIAEHDEEAVDE